MRASWIMIGMLGAAAHASPGFPTVIGNDVEGASVDCTLCHTDPSGGANATKPIVAPLRERGMIAFDDASLSAALVRLRDDAVDTDADGAIDVDELASNTDPNAAPDGPAPLEVGYGFGCAQSPSSTWPMWLCACLMMSRKRGQR
jgi:hypothetical protein